MTKLNHRGLQPTITPLFLERSHMSKHTNPQVSNAAPPPPAASLSVSVEPTHTRIEEGRAREGDVLDADGGSVLDGDEVDGGGSERQQE